jgi:hypothetical protein
MEDSFKRAGQKDTTASFPSSKALRSTILRRCVPEKVIAPRCLSSVRVRLTVSAERATLPAFSQRLPGLTEAST